MQAHTQVHGDSWIAVQRAVVIARWPLVDVEPAEHLPGRLVPRHCGVGIARRLWTVVVEDAEVHGPDQPIHLSTKLRQRLPDDHQT